MLTKRLRGFATSVETRKIVCGHHVGQVNFLLVLWFLSKVKTKETPPSVAATEIFEVFIFGKQIPKVLF